MIKRNSYIVVMITCLVIGSAFGVLLIKTSRSIVFFENTSSLDKPSVLIEFADSIRNSDPDTAIYYYLTVNSILEQAKDGESRDHLLALSHTGLAYVYSEKGEYKLAMKNDSIAMQIATVNKDKAVIAKALLVKGMILYWHSEYDKAMLCYQEAMDIALLLKDLELKAKIHANQAMIYFHQGENQKTLDGFNMALSLGKQLNNQAVIAANYMNLAVVYANLSKNDSLLPYYNRALYLLQKLNDKNVVLKCYNNLGNVYYDLSDFGKAIEYYQLSVKLAMEMDDKSNLAKGYHNLAEVYIHLGDNDTAAELLFQSIKIKEQLNDKKSLAKGYYGLGEIYYNRNDYPKSLTYFKKSLNLSKEINYLAQIGSSYTSIANVYSDVNDNDSAIFYYDKAMELYQQMEYTYGISNIYINLGDVYRVKKDYYRSEKLLLNALKTKTELAEEEGVALVNYHLANLYLSKAADLHDQVKVNLLQKAEAVALTAYKIAYRINILPVRRNVSKTLYKIYQEQGRFREALHFSEICSSLSDSILNKDKIQALTFAEARWNIEKKQQEIDNLKNTQKLNQEIIQQKETESRQQRLITWFIGVLLLLSLISAAIFTLYFRKRRDAIYQKQLSQMTLLRMQNVHNVMSPHFIFNVLASLSGLSNHPEIINAKIKSLSLLLRKVIENIDRTAVTLEEELSAVKAYIDLYSHKLPEPFTVEYLIDKGTKLHELIPAMIIQIPVENAIKHGLMPMEGDKKLTISITQLEDYQQITVTDNGIGLKASAGRSTGTGMGLKVLMQTIQLLNAKNQRKINFSFSEIESSQERSSGTIVKIQVPYDFSYTT